MHVEAGLPDQLEKSANELRNIGFDELAEALEDTAEKAREVRADA